MQTEIQNLINHPEAIRETLNTDQLDGLIQKATGLNLTMQYHVEEGRSSVRFEAEAKDDLVGASGIFSKVLTECRIDTFSSLLKYTPEEGFHVWFSLNLSYQHFNGGSNGMKIADFQYKNGEWTMSNFKGEREDI